MSGARMRCSRIWMNLTIRIFPVGHRLVLKEQDPTSWGANEVYRLYQEEGWYMNWYLLCYEDRIIDIRFDWEPTTDDMAIVNQKLNP